MSTHPVLSPMNIWRQYGKSLQWNGSADTEQWRLRCIQGLCQMTCSRYRARELISLTIKGRRGPPLKAPPTGRVERTCRVEFRVRLTEKKARKSLAVGPFPRVTSLGEGPRACPT